MASSKIEEAVRAIDRLTSVDDFAMVHFGPLDRYAKAIGVTEEEADELLELASQQLVREGRWTEVSGSYYSTIRLELLEQEEEYLAMESERYLADVEAEYKAAKGFV